MAPPTIGPAIILDEKTRLMKGAKDDELGYGLSGTTCCGEDGEDEQSDAEEKLATEYIGQLGKDDEEANVAEKVRGNNPGAVVEAAQIVCDADQSCGDDGYLEIGQEKRDSDPVVLIVSDMKCALCLWGSAARCLERTRPQ